MTGTSRGQAAWWSAFGGGVCGFAFTKALVSVPGVRDVEESWLLVVFPAALIGLEVVVLPWSVSGLAGGAVMRRYVFRWQWLVFWIPYCAGATPAYLL